MNTPVLLLLALFVLSGRARSEVAIYYGSITYANVQPNVPTSLLSSPSVVVIDLDASADTVRGVYYLFKAPSRYQGSAFDFFYSSPFTTKKLSITAGNQASVTFFADDSHMVAGDTDIDKITILSGANVSVKTNYDAAVARLLPGSLFGQVVEGQSTTPTYGNLEIATLSLGLLLPQTQFENAKQHTFEQAREDVENYLQSIGGHK